jgi:hypothetical protein
MLSAYRAVGVEGEGRVPSLLVVSRQSATQTGPVRHADRSAVADSFVVIRDYYSRSYDEQASQTANPPHRHLVALGWDIAGVAERKPAAMKIPNGHDRRLDVQPAIR